jgi:hypothetical protein
VICYTESTPRLSHTETCRFDPLECIDTVSKILHSLTGEVFGGLNLQQEDRGRDVHGVGLRRDDMSVTERSRKEAEDHQRGIGSFKALSQMVAILRIIDVVLFAVCC